jgi:hypothetical protein
MSKLRQENLYLELESLMDTHTINNRISGFGQTCDHALTLDLLDRLYYLIGLTSSEQFL